MTTTASAPVSESFTSRVATGLFLVVKFKLVTGLLFLRKRLYAAVSSAGRDRPMVNIGGGLFFRPHWKVLDFCSAYYSFARRMIDHDIDLMQPGAQFPFSDNSVQFFYSAHTLEHIPQEYCANILREVYRCLKPGGAVRLCMPDYDLLRRAADQHDEVYFKGQRENGLSFEEAVIEQIATDLVGKIPADEIRADYQRLDPVSFADHYTNRVSRDSQRRNGGYHINWFTYDKLAGMLREAGFATIYRSAAQQSRFPELTGKGGLLATGDFFEVQRMLGIDTTLPDRSLYVEAVK